MGRRMTVRADRLERARRLRELEAEVALRPDPEPQPAKGKRPGD